VRDRLEREAREKYPDSELMHLHWINQQASALMKQAHAV